MTRYEDAGCVNPCGMEPMGCRTCPELGNTGRPHDKDYFLDLMERLGDDYDAYCEMMDRGEAW